MSSSYVSSSSSSEKSKISIGNNINYYYNYYHHYRYYHHYHYKKNNHCSYKFRTSPPLNLRACVSVVEFGIATSAILLSSDDAGTQTHDHIMSAVSLRQPEHSRGPGTSAFQLCDHGPGRPEDRSGAKHARPEQDATRRNQNKERQRLWHFPSRAHRHRAGASGGRNLSWNLWPAGIVLNGKIFDRSTLICCLC